MVFWIMTSHSLMIIGGYHLLDFDTIFIQICIVGFCHECIFHMRLNYEEKSIIVLNFAFEHAIQYNQTSVMGDD